MTSYGTLEIELEITQATEPRDSNRVLKSLRVNPYRSAESGTPANGITLSHLTIHATPAYSLLVSTLRKVASSLAKHHDSYIPPRPLRNTRI